MIVVVEIDDILVQIYTENDLESLIDKFPDAKIHRLHFRRDLGKFVDEVLTVDDVSKEKEINMDYFVGW